ncbi:MAG TPA: hypothetical protein DIV38_00415 [Clostridiales bacterium]|nr:hypothetical protein [Clostridiales bacterium]
MKQIEATGKKIDDAINAGLKELGVTLSEVNVEILEQGGFFRKAKVRLTVEDDEDLFVKKPVEKEAVAEVAAKPEKPAVKPEPKPVVKQDKPAVKPEPKPAVKQDKPAAKPEVKAAVKPEPKKENKPEPKPAAQKFEKRQSADTRPAPIKPETAKPEAPVRPVDPEQVKIATDYLEKVLSLMNVTAELKVDTSHGSIDIDIVSDDSSVIGHRGEVLDALQILAKRAVEEGNDKFVHVNVDSRNYRVKREQSLVALANRMAAKCVKTGRKVVLEPMSSTHRKIIHAALTDNDKVITKSEGKDPNRKVVILPKRY